jgi:predicted Zn-dependent protease
MMRPLRFLARAAAVAAATVLALQPVAAQSILRDAETEQFLRDVMTPLAEVGGLDPRSVQVALIGDPAINAFVSGGQNVFFFSGLIEKADDVSEVQGVMAHELGHITGGHNVRIADGASAATGISVLSLILGAAAIAAGAGDAGMAAMMAGQQAATGKFLAFSRSVESSADQAGASFLHKAGVTGRGKISFFRKLAGEAYRYGFAKNDIDAYAQTHPLSQDRIVALQEVLEASPHWNKPVDPVLNARFLRVKAKLQGFVNEPARTFQIYPETDQSVAARYARAYAWHKSAFPDKAVAEVDKLLANAPSDPYFLELKGQILLESGRVQESLPSLRLAVRAAPEQPLIASLLGHALISTETKENMTEATALLKAAVSRDNSNPFAWYQLGIAYDRQGDEPRAALASAERFNLMGVPRMALPNAKRAMAGLKTGSPDWLRAQDIVMVSQNALEKDRKGRRQRPEA